MTHRIAFIGLGNMGGGMAANQAKAGHAVAAFDLSQDAMDRAATAGCTPVGSVAEAVRDADVVITMLPAGPHVLKVCSEQIIGVAPTSALLLDCSTIDVDTARKVAGLARDAGYAFADAPVSGGTMAADAGTLAFMVGCDEPDFARIEAALEPMSRATFRAGDHGAGQAAKICNNMILGITMLGTCEAIGLAEAGVRHLQQDLTALRLVPTAEDIAGLDADGYLGELIAELRDAQSLRTDPEAARVASHALTLLATFLLEGRGVESPA
jgi:3-hydroxyisobutyrate dehydrogenase